MRSRPWRHLLAMKTRKHVDLVSSGRVPWQPGQCRTSCRVRDGRLSELSKPDFDSRKAGTWKADADVSLARDSREAPSHRTRATAVCHHSVVVAVRMCSSRSAYVASEYGPAHCRVRGSGAGPRCSTAPGTSVPHVGVNLVSPSRLPMICATPGTNGSNSPAANRATSSGA